MLKETDGLRRSNSFNLSRGLRSTISALIMHSQMISLFFERH